MNANPKQPYVLTQMCNVVVQRIQVPNHPRESDHSEDDRISLRPLDRPLHGAARASHGKDQRVHSHQGVISRCSLVSQSQYILGPWFGGQSPRAAGESKFSTYHPVKWRIFANSFRGNRYTYNDAVFENILYNLWAFYLAHICNIVLEHGTR